MAITEVFLLALALNLAGNPSDSDIQKYQSLSPADQATVQEMIDHKDELPAEIEKLIEQGTPPDVKGVNQISTNETSTGI